MIITCLEEWIMKAGSAEGLAPKLAPPCSPIGGVDSSPLSLTAQAEAEQDTESVINDALLDTPPKARLTIRVGAVGHRHSGLADADLALVNKAVVQVLRSIHEVGQEVYSKSFYSSESPVLRIVSALADGSDRIVSCRALELGFELQCPIPFLRDEYEMDFEAEDSKRQYRELLAKATSLFELDGQRSEGR